MGLLNISICLRLSCVTCRKIGSFDR